MALKCLSVSKRPHSTHQLPVALRVTLAAPHFSPDRLCELMRRPHWWAFGWWLSAEWLVVFKFSVWVSKEWSLQSIPACEVTAKVQGYKCRNKCRNISSPCWQRVTFPLFRWANLKEGCGQWSCLHRVPVLKTFVDNLLPAVPKKLFNIFCPFLRKWDYSQALRMKTIFSKNV